MDSIKIRCEDCGTEVEAPVNGSAITVSCSSCGKSVEVHTRDPEEPLPVRPCRVSVLLTILVIGALLALVVVRLTHRPRYAVPRARQSFLAWDRGAWKSFLASNAYEGIREPGGEVPVVAAVHHNGARVVLKFDDREQMVELCFMGGGGNHSLRGESVTEAEIKCLELAEEINPTLAAAFTTMLLGDRHVREQPKWYWFHNTHYAVSASGGNQLKLKHVGDRGENFDIHVLPKVERADEQRTGAVLEQTGGER